MTEDLLDPFSQPPLIQALLVARHTLVVHNGMRVTAEGESWTLDFASDLAKIDAALKEAGIDTTKPLLAPVKW